MATVESILVTAVLGLVAAIHAPATADGSPPIALDAMSSADSICAQLSTDTASTCLPTEHGPAEAWTLVASRWRQPPGPVSAPIVAMWAVPSAPLDDLALNRDGAFAAFSKHIDEVLGFVKDKNAESYLASLQRQKEILDRITARKEELSRPK
jgi:hypothetical protein